MAALGWQLNAAFVGLLEQTELARGMELLVRTGTGPWGDETSLKLLMLELLLFIAVFAHLHYVPQTLLSFGDLSTHRMNFKWYRW